MSRPIKNFKDIFPHELERIQNAPPIEPGKKRIYFTGTGRCGTTYISRVMKELGFDFGHEIMRRHGQSSYKITPWLNEIRATGESVIVRLYRSKKKTVESIMRQGYFHPGRAVYKRFIILLPEVEGLRTYRERVNFYYDYWYKLSENKADFTFDIEAFTYLDLKSILNAAGYDISEADIRAAMMNVDPKGNTNEHKKNVNYEKEFK